VTAPAVKRVSTQPEAGEESAPAEIIENAKANIWPHLETLEHLRGCKVIAYFLDDNAALADEQMLHLYEHLRRIGKQDQIDLWLSSRGGATEIPWKIVSLMREFAKRFAVLIPYRAHSAATHIALGADEIVMTEMSELGPVDPSRRHPLLPQEETKDGRKIPVPISVQDLRHVLEFIEREMGGDLTPEAGATVYTALFDKVHPLAIGALEQSWALSRQITTRVLSTHMDPEKEADAIEALAERLSEHYKSHLYQISRREAHEMGLKVSDASEEETEAMWQLYVAYSHLQIGGEGEIMGEPAIATRIGHIDSKVGTTVGLGLAKKSDPTQAVGSRWQSHWFAGPAAAQPGEPVVPQPNGEAGSPAPQ